MLSPVPVTMARILAKTIISREGLDTHAILLLSNLTYFILMVRAMKRLTLFAILLNILFVSCANQSGNDPTREPVYLVTVKSPSDEVTIQNGDNNTAIDIHSVTGIGSA